MATPPRQIHVPAQTETESGIRNQDETAAQPASDATAAPGFGPPAEPGEVGTLGPNRVVKELGRGGMGAVYAALDTRLDRRLALKVLLPRYAADAADADGGSQARPGCRGERRGRKRHWGSARKEEHDRLSDRAWFIPRRSFDQPAQLLPQALQDAAAREQDDID